MRTYSNKITGLLRKFDNDTGYASSDNGKTWEENKTSEGLIKQLSYYEIVKK